MAQRLDPFQKAELVDFLETMYRLGHYTTQRQWAEDAGYGTVAMSNALNRNTNDGVGGYTLFKLIRAAARRAEVTPAEAVRRSTVAASVEQIPDDRLTEIAGMVAEGLARVQAGIADVARRLPPAAPRPLQEEEPG